MFLLPYAQVVSERTERARGFPSALAVDARLDRRPPPLEGKTIFNVIASDSIHFSPLPKDGIGSRALQVPCQAAPCITIVSVDGPQTRSHMSVAAGSSRPIIGPPGVVGVAGGSLHVGALLRPPSGRPLDPESFRCNLGRLTAAAIIHGAFCNPYPLSCRPSRLVIGGIPASGTTMSRAQPS